MMVHLALDGPVPWAAGEHISKCSYVHIGPYTEDINRAYYDSLLGYLPKSPLLVLVSRAASTPRAPPRARRPCGCRCAPCRRSPRVTQPAS